jgi:sterol desaturase/sphingolipid hydroxylase (fatty acid hydroxylase superfamily)
MVTAVIFAIAGSLCMMAWERGYTRLYTGNEYPLWWTILSPILVIFIQESYYYWIHRWMHIPSVFRKVHRVHHDSHITSPWTAFSFHPLEGFLQALIIPLLIIIIPIHLYALLFLLVFMSVTSVINHLDIEIYPSWMIRSRIGRMMIGATHHSLHHKQYKYNFGLYFTFWDRWLKTESPLFGKTSAETDKKKVLQQPLQDPG